MIYSFDEVVVLFMIMALCFACGYMYRKDESKNEK
jgi:hypothetical protein